MIHEGTIPEQIARILEDTEGMHGPLSGPLAQIDCVLRAVPYCDECSHAADACECVNLDALNQLTREECVERLEGVGIQCHDLETVEVLREAVRVNVADGTLDDDRFSP